MFGPDLIIALLGFAMWLVVLAPIIAYLTLRVVIRCARKRGPLPPVLARVEMILLK